MNNTLLLRQIKEYLSSRFPEIIEKIILFGSRIEGNAREHSDYDLLIIVKGKHDWRQKDDILDAICELNIKYDIIIDAHIISTGELATIRGKQPFIQHAIETGVFA